MSLWPDVETATEFLLRTSSLGVNEDAPATTGTIAVTMGANAATGIRVKSAAGATTGKFIDFQNNAGSTLFTVDIAGKIGSGTDTPTQQAHLVSASTTGTALRIQNTDTGGGDYRLVASGSDNTGGAGKFHVFDEIATAFWLTVDGGRVGVGTVAPLATLQLATLSATLAGTGNPYALYAYPTSSGEAYLDAITGGANGTALSLRTYNNGAYHVARLGSDGLFTAKLANQGGAVYDVTAYGLSAASADNTAAWVALTALLPSGGDPKGARIRFPAGKFTFLSQITIPPGADVEGAGMFATTLGFSGAHKGLVGVSAGPSLESGHRLSNLAIQGTRGTGSTVGIHLEYRQEITLDRVRVTGFVQQGIYANHTIMMSLDHCLIGDTGDATHAQVEVDNSTAFHWYETYISGTNADTFAGLAVDRAGSGVTILGGAIESTGTLIRLAGKTEGSLSVNGVTILGTDFENPNGGAISVIEMGAGWTGAAGGAVTSVVIDNITASASGSATMAHVIRATNTSSVHVGRINGGVPASPQGVSLIELVGTGNVGWTGGRIGAQPGAGISVVRVNGTARPDIRADEPWELDGRGWLVPASGALQIASPTSSAAAVTVGRSSGTAGASSLSIDRNGTGGFAAALSFKNAGVEQASVYNANDALLRLATLGTDRVTVSASGTALAGYMELPEIAAPGTPSAGGRLYFDASHRLSWKGTNGFVRTLDATANAADRVYTLPNVTGTVAVLSAQNVFTAEINLGADVILSGTLTPPALSGDVNDYAPTGIVVALALRVDGGASDRNITGLGSGSPQDGRIITITNIGATNNLVLKNQSASSLAADRFLLPADTTLPPDTAIALRYDGTSARWRPWSRALANSGAAAGTYGSATQAAQVTVDVAGRVTSVANVTIAPPFSAITGTATAAQLPAALSSQTSINGLGITASTGVVTIPNGVTVTGPAASDTLVGRASTDTLTNKTLTAPTIAGGTHTGITSLGIRDTGAAFDLTIAATGTGTSAGRVLTLDVVNAARTIKLGGNLTLAGDLITAGAFGVTLTATATTAVTLPTTGTLATQGATPNTFLRVSGINSGSLASNIELDQADANTSRILAWGPDTSTRGTLLLSVLTSTAGLLQNGITISNTGAVSMPVTLDVVGGYKANGTAGVTQTSAAVTALATIGGIVTTFTPVSDIDLKEWSTFPHGLADLRRLLTIRFTWNSIALEHDPFLAQFGEMYGFAAQNVRAVAPELVGVERWEDGREWLTLRSDRAFTVWNTNAIIELDDKVEREIATLKQDIGALTARLADLESRRN